MGKKSVLALVLTGSLFAASSAMADHNSIWGAGTANMPNDIHNTVIEDGSDALMDLVQYGDGADSVNRYDDTDTDTTVGGGSTSLSGSSASTRDTGMSRVGQR